MPNSFANLFKKAYKIAEKRGKFEGRSFVNIKKDIEEEDAELYDELWDCHIKKQFTLKAEREAWDGIIIRLNELKNNEVNLIQSLTDYVKYQEQRED